MINVLLVDDHELVRTGIQALLNAVADISVVAVANSGERAIFLMDKLMPDVVLMDINMPGIGGAEACRRILQQYPQMRIIALSAHNDGLVPAQLLELGAMGFISKSSPVEEMVEAIHTVMSGGCYLCNDVASTVSLKNAHEVDKNPFAKLSKREAEVVSLILQGKNIQEISVLLDLSDKTINTYRYRLYEKLHVKNDVELTRLAVKFNHVDSGFMLNDLKFKNLL
jgi:two-component system invasion response regulator UvrY